MIRILWYMVSLGWLLLFAVILLCNIFGPKGSSEFAVVGWLIAFSVIGLLGLTAVALFTTLALWVLNGIARSRDVGNLEQSPKEKPSGEEFKQTVTDEAFSLSIGKEWYIKSRVRATFAFIIGVGVTSIIFSSTVLPNIVRSFLNGKSTMIALVVLGWSLWVFWPSVKKGFSALSRTVSKCS